jgi:hypothetical protein
VSSQVKDASGVAGVEGQGSGDPRLSQCTGRPWGRRQPELWAPGLSAAEWSPKAQESCVSITPVTQDSHPGARGAQPLLPLSPPQPGSFPVPQPPSPPSSPAALGDGAEAPGI